MGLRDADCLSRRTEGGWGWQTKGGKSIQGAPDEENCLQRENGWKIEHQRQHDSNQTARKKSKLNGDRGRVEFICQLEKFKAASTDLKLEKRR